MSLRQRVRALRVDINTIQTMLIERGYSSVFSHSFGNDNIATLWLNLQTGDEVMTIARRAEKYGNDISFRHTEMWRLYPVFNFLGDNDATATSPNDGS